jgi:hypothetical protein
MDATGRIAMSRVLHTLENNYFFVRLEVKLFAFDYYKF